MNDFIMENNIGNENENNNNLLVEIDGTYKAKLNGEMIDKVNLEVTYDGHELDLEAKRKNESIYMKLSNDDVLKLFEVPAYHKTITERLVHDLNPENKIDVRPIIIEELENISNHHSNHHSNHTNSNKSKHTRRKHNIKNNDNHSKSKNKIKNKSKNKSKSKSKSKNKNMSKSRSRSKTNHYNQHLVPPSPDYLKTIY